MSIQVTGTPSFLDAHSGMRPASASFELPSVAVYERPPTPKDIQGLRLANMQLGDAGLHAALMPLHKDHPYGALFLSGNGIGQSGAESLKKALLSDTRVEHLILHNNKLTDFAVAALADLFKVNHHIGWIVLSDNAIGQFGLNKLAESLELNKGVKHLVLTGNEIEDVSVLADKLADHPKLESLFLAGNIITDIGAMGLLKLMSTSGSLRLIDLRDNDLSEGMKSTLRNTADRYDIRIKL